MYQELVFAKSVLLLCVRSIKPNDLASIMAHLQCRPTVDAMNALLTVISGFTITILRRATMLLVALEEHAII